MADRGGRAVLGALLAVCLSTAPAAAQALRAITQDGRVVILQPDGTWRFAEEPKAVGSSPVVKARPPGATILLAGSQVPYGIWVDLARWRVDQRKQNPVAEYEFHHVRGEAGAVVIAEPTRVPPEAWRQIVLTNARRQAADARITAEERKVVNGIPLLALQYEGTGPMGPFIHYGYYWSGPRGAVQLVTYTFAPLFPQYQAELTAFLDGFVLLE